MKMTGCASSNPRCICCWSKNLKILFCECCTSRGTNAPPRRYTEFPPLDLPDLSKEVFTHSQFLTVPGFLFIPLTPYAAPGAETLVQQARSLFFLWLF